MIASAFCSGFIHQTEILLTQLLMSLFNPASDTKAIKQHLSDGSIRPEGGLAMLRPVLPALQSNRSDRVILSAGQSMVDYRLLIFRPFAGVPQQTGFCFIFIHIPNL
ncbi:MAG: hypothetical protein SV429_00710 [Pseudomonadota bacterium]|nr:hypothetical protein [Pseudomonadota bacterium]